MVQSEVQNSGLDRATCTQKEKVTHPLMFSAHVLSGQNSVSRVRPAHPWEAATTHHETPSMCSMSEEEYAHEIHMIYTREHTDTRKPLVHPCRANELGNLQQGGQVVARDEKGVHLGEQAQKDDTSRPDVDGCVSVIPNTTPTATILNRGEE